MGTMAKQALIVSTLLALLTASPASAQAPAPLSAEKPAGAPVRFGEEDLLTVYDSVGAFTPQDRAAAIAERLRRLSTDPLTAPDTITTVDREHLTEIVAGDKVVMTVTDGDARPLGKPRQTVAKEYAFKIQQVLSRTREETSSKAILMDVLFAVIDTLVLILVLVVFHRYFPKLYATIEDWRGTRIKSIKLQRVEILSASQIAEALIAAATAVRVVATLLILYFYVSTVLGVFPWTKGISAQLFGAVLTTLKAIGQAFATYVPDVVSIIVIIFVVRVIIKLIHVVFLGIERGAVTFAGFHREWAEPTYKIVRFLVIVFGAVAIFPYVPGSDSPAFRAFPSFSACCFPWAPPALSAMSFPGSS